MIELFACKETRKIWNRQFSKKLPSEIQQRAFEK
ncbi:MAG TPA: type II toxin-antitoxin system RelE/ParE family toxin, partial [Candidatus Lambdaproteobacteria bacterium]|nr:type II toxin-antitoxin system RelE/ParE family toxin [Candidatus Lambdaproteobacteria bacterium]